MFDYLDALDLVCLLEMFALLNVVVFALFGFGCFVL